MRVLYWGRLKKGSEESKGMLRSAVRLGLLALLACPGTALRGQDEAAHPEFYTEHVKPILTTNCYRCHGGMNHRGGLNIETRAGMLKGGHDGTVLVPGDAAKSLLVRLMRHEGPANDPMPMPPPPRAKVSDADIAVVERWVRAGAMMPEDTPRP